jgi:hypothetical protein
MDRFTSITAYLVSENNQQNSLLSAPSSQNASQSLVQEKEQPASLEWEEFPVDKESGSGSGGGGYCVIA